MIAAFHIMIRNKVSELSPWIEQSRKNLGAFFVFEVIKDIRPVDAAIVLLPGSNGRPAHRTQARQAADARPSRDRPLSAGSHGRDLNSSTKCKCTKIGLAPKLTPQNTGMAIIGGLLPTMLSMRSCCGFSGMLGSCGACFCCISSLRLRSS